MSSSPLPGAVENDEVVETVDVEAPRPGHAAESAGTEVEAGAATNHTVPSPHVLNDGPDEYEDSDDEYDGDDIATDEDMDDDVSDVDDYLDEERGKFSESAEIEATLEALWRKVVSVEEKPPPAGQACSVCMEHLTCEGAHRICCIPCGHVYGRSCLERCLRYNGNETARCPQCALMFADNQIIDLYAPANLWEGCGSVQEVKVYVTKAIAEVMVQYEGKMEAASSKIAKLKAEQRYNYAKLMELKDLVAQTVTEQSTQIQSLNAVVEKVCVGMKSLLDVKFAEIELIKEQIAAAKLAPPPPKPEESCRRKTHRSWTTRPGGLSSPTSGSAPVNGPVSRAPDARGDVM